MVASVKKINYLNKAAVFLVRGNDGDNPAWHYIAVDKLKLSLFKKKLKEGSFDIASYGKILCSGWGKNPPTEVAQKMKDLYGY